jgi:hypothetical protein
MSEEVCVMENDEVCHFTSHRLYFQELLAVNVQI